MRRPSSILFLALAACGPPPSGTAYARISADAALSSPFTTEDGWTLSFTHVVVAVSSFKAVGAGVSAFTTAQTASKLIDFAKDSRVDLDTNTSASPRTYDALSVVFSRAATDENVNVAADVTMRVGNRAIYLEGTATKQSTTRQFQIGLPVTVTYDGCMPALTLEAMGTATLDFRVHAQRAFFDDAGKMRFEAWALADTAPADGVVLNSEAATVQTSTLPAAQYGATTGSLMDVITKRSLQLVGVGDSGTCTGK